MTSFHKEREYGKCKLISTNRKHLTAALCPGMIYGKAFEREHPYYEEDTGACPILCGCLFRRCIPQNLRPGTCLGWLLCMCTAAPGSPMTAWAASYLSTHNDKKTPVPYSEQIQMLCIGWIPCCCLACSLADKLDELSPDSNAPFI